MLSSQLHDQYLPFLIFAGFCFAFLTYIGPRLSGVLSVLVTAFLAVGGTVSMIAFVLSYKLGPNWQQFKGTVDVGALAHTASIALGAIMGAVLVLIFILGPRKK